MRHHPTGLAVALAGLCLLVAGPARADGISIGIDPGTIDVGGVVIHADPLAGMQVFPLIGSGDLSSLITGVDAAGNLAGFHAPDGFPPAGFVLFNRGAACDAATLDCQLANATVTGFSVLPGFRAATSSQRDMTWDFGSSQVAFMHSPVLLGYAGDNDVVTLCRLEQPPTADTLLAAMTPVCTDVGQGAASGIIGELSYANGNGFFVDIEQVLATSAPPLYAAGDTPVTTYAAPAGTEYIAGVAPGPVLPRARVIDARGNGVLTATLGMEYVAGVNDHLVVAGATAQDGSGLPLLYALDGGTAVSPLPRQWVVGSAYGDITVPFTTVWPVAINNDRVILKVGAYGTATATGDFAALITATPFGAADNALFYCLLAESCATAYPLGGSTTLTGATAADQLLAGAVDAAPKVHASGYGFRLGNDGWFTGHHDRGNGDEPFLLDVQAATPAPLWLRDHLDTSAWTCLHLSARNAAGVMTGYGTLAASGTISGFVVAWPGAAAPAAGQSDGGGVMGWWVLLFMGMAGIGRRRLTTGVWC